MKKSKKICMLLISALVVCAMVISVLVLHFNTAPTVRLGFYGVSPKVQNAILETIQANSNVKLQVTANINPPFKNCDLVIFQNDAPTATFMRKNSKSLNPALLSGYPSSLQKAVELSSGDGVKVLPFLYDFYEIDINYPLYTKAGIDSVDVWEDLIVCAYKEKPLTPAPMLLPFATDAEFLNCVGMIAEALCGYEEYEKMIEEFRIASEAEASVEESEADFTSLHRVLETLTAEDKILGSTLGEIKSLLRSGIIPRNALTFSDEDVFFYMDNELSGVNFTKLSQHRKVSKQAANHLISVYCPSVEATPERKFSADCICVSALKKNKNALRFVGLLSDDWQNELATKTGLAPVQKNSLVPDHQADDVRFWLAASKGPVLPLARVFFTPEQQQFAATYLRTALKL